MVNAQGLLHLLGVFKRAQMGLIREALRETGAIFDPSGAPALGSVELAPSFKGVGGAVAAEEAEFIAQRLERGLNAGLVGELFSFFGDAPREATEYARSRRSIAPRSTVAAICLSTFDAAKGPLVRLLSKAAGINPTKTRPGEGLGHPVFGQAQRLDGWWGRRPFLPQTVPYPLRSSASRLET